MPLLRPARVIEAPAVHLRTALDDILAKAASGQHIEARLGFGTTCGNDFGILASGFFLNFLNTTEEFRVLIELLRDWHHNASIALELLEKRRHLRRVQSAHGNSGGWALNE